FLPDDEWVTLLGKTRICITRSRAGAYQVRSGARPIAKDRGLGSQRVPRCNKCTDALSVQGQRRSKDSPGQNRNLASARPSTTDQRLALGQLSALCQFET